MKDSKFLDFENWFMRKTEVWKQNGLKLTKTSYIETPQRHSYYIALENEHDGSAEIVLYESNNIYWVDFEAWNGISDELFVKAGIRYTSSRNLMDVENKFLEYMEA